MTTDDLRDSLIRIVEYNTGGPGTPNKQPLLMGKGTLRQHLSLIGYTAAESNPAIEDAIATGDILGYHGKVAPADDAHLLAIIEDELDADFRRTALIGRCNALRKQLREAKAEATHE